MKKLFVFLILLTALPTLVLAQSLPGDVIRQVAQSVVQIVAIDNGEPFSQGSGTIVDPRGFIFTNVHVIEGGDEFAILMLEDVAEPPVLRFFAQPVQTFPDLDFAILQIVADADGRAVDNDSLNLPFITLADEPVELGDSVHIFGFPGIGDGFLVFTNGSITTIQNEDFGSAGRLPLLYQTDAEISPGNSGGTAVNDAGEFIGIPTVVRSEERTGGRLGGIVTLTAIRTVLDLQAPQGSGGGTQEDLPDIEDAPPTPPPDYTTLDYNLQANYGGIQLEAGFREDPHVVEIVSGATEDAFVDVASLQLGENCLGYATPSPDYKVLWSGESQGFRAFFYSPDGGDTTLIINQPDGSWLCSDDSFNTLNPTIDILNPQEGQYDIWVGSYTATQNIPGYLVVTEIAEIDPTNFADILEQLLQNQ